MTNAVLDLSAKINASLKASSGIEAPAPGVHAGVDFADYTQWNAASFSRLSILRDQTPAHLKAELEQPTDTAALRQGRAIHCAVLEPDSFNSRYVIARQCGALTKEKKQCSKLGVEVNGTDWRCSTHGGTAGRGGVSVVSEADYKMALAARDALWSHPAFKRLLAGARTELSLSWKDDETGIPCKARLDLLSPLFARGAIVDVKSTANASKEAFEKSIHNYGYASQGSWYFDGAAEVGLADDAFVYIAAQEKDPPYLTAIYALPEVWLEDGRSKMREWVRIYADCLAKDEWPGYPTEVRDALPPAFAVNSFDLNRGDRI